MFRYRTLLLFFLACLAGPAPAAPRAVVLEFELIDEMRDAGAEAGDRDRLALVSQRFPAALAACGSVELVPVPRAEVDRIANQIAYLHQCNGCAEDIARAAGAERVVFTWVQKVSNLILNLNAEIQDSNGRVLRTRSVDLRGNTDQSWARAADALAKRLCPSER